MNQYASILRNVTLTLAIGLLPWQGAVFAGSATWANIPTNLNWNVAGNWVPATIPNGPADTATFGASFAHAISISANTEVGGIVFTPDATGQYAITTNPANTLTISGVGITNNSPTAVHSFVTASSGTSSGLTRFTNSASAGVRTAFTIAGSGVTFVNGGVLQFNDTSTAAFGTFLSAAGTAYGARGGIVEFRNSSTAGHGAFTSNGSLEDAGTNGTTQFFNSSTADHGTFTNKSSGVGGYYGGFTKFYDASTAGNGVFINVGREFAAAQEGETEFFGNSTAANGTFTNMGAAASYGGLTYLRDSSTAANGTFTNWGATVANAYGGSTEFAGSATAGNGTFITNGGAVSGAYGGYMTFYENSTAENGTFSVSGGAVSGAYGGYISFQNSSSAGNGTFSIYGGTVSGAFHGQIEFRDNSSAGNGTFIVYGSPFASTPNTGLVFSYDSDGGMARIELSNNGGLDISRHNTPGVTTGSIEGMGNLFLGARKLAVGSNDASTEFSGVIQDGGSNGGTGGSLTKIGTGTLTLSGTNTYTGGTTVSGGTLAVNGSILGTVMVNDGAILGGTGTVGGQVWNVGTINPGSSVGTLTVNGNVTMVENSHFLVELSGATADKLVINGNVDLSALNNLLDVMGTGTGTSWQIASYTGTLTGTFENVTSGYTVDYGTGTNSVITLDHGLPGDYNGDNKVDAADYVAWRLNPAGHGGTPGGYNTWRSNFGQPGPGSGSGVSANGAVPEPATFALIIVGILVMSSGRRVMVS